MENKNKPVYPFSETLEDSRGNDKIYYNKGLTKREYFAAMAMQGLLASCTNTLIDKKVMDNLPQCAIDMADSILKQLENEQ